MSREEIRNQWRELVEEFRNSDESAAAWCRARNLNVTQFRRWIRKFGNEATPVRWLPVEVQGAVENEKSSVIVHVGAASVEVRNGFNSLLLKQVVQALAD
jgi:hypothetical protein